MLKIIALLIIVVATVTGQMQLQNNDQDSPVNHIQLQSVLGPPPVIYKDGMPIMARRKPCQKRRRLQTPDGKNPSAGWVPLFKSVHSVEQNVPDLNNEQLKPQSLKESKFVTQEDQGNVFEHPLQNPVNNAELRSAPAQSDLMIEKLVTTRNKLSNNGIEEPVDELCRSLEEAEDTVAQANKVTNKNIKPASDEVNNQAIKLISKCVQDVQDVKNAAGEETTSRRSFSGHSSPSTEKISSSNFNVPVNEDNDNTNRHDDIQTNNDFDASQPNLVRSKVAASAGEEERKAPIEIINELQHPVLRAFVTNISDSQVSLLKNGRVCYACSSANDPSCWQPSRTTSVKYCKKNDDACISKTIKIYDGLIMTRDCGNTCNENNLPGVSPKYKSCRICHSDLCNSAITIDSFNLLLLTFLMAAFKYAL